MMFFKKEERMKPKIKNLNGVNTKKIINKDSFFVSPSYTRLYPFVIKKGKGLWVEDVDGNIFLDFTAGIAVNSTGHCHPEIVKVIKKQLDKFIHMSGTDFYYDLQIELSKKLSQLYSIKERSKVFLCNSGTEAIEASFKLARYYTAKKRNIAFEGAFHGRTMGSLSLSKSKDVHKDGFEPLLEGIIHVPYANCYRCKYEETVYRCGFKCVDKVNEILESDDDVSAVFVEPIQGEGGYIVPPFGFLRKLRKITSNHGVLLVVDEIQCGMGRTGRMFTYQYEDIKPDIVVLAKGIASGMPLGAVIASDRIMSWAPGKHATTFGGNPLSCVAALKTIELLEKGLIHNADNIGTYLLCKFNEMVYKYPFIGDVRGRGLMIGMEIIDDPYAKRENVVLRNRIIQKCFERGLLLLGCGKSSIRFSPSLTIKHYEADICLDILKSVLKEI
uniref:Putative aminotransferase n=1 Tax=viral metagenome TaxID=1070528 RepID=A0A6M3JX22_9ZZZZ